MLYTANINRLVSIGHSIARIINTGYKLAIHIDMLIAVVKDAGKMEPFVKRIC